MNELVVLVVELVYWRDPRKSGVVFGGTLLFLLSLAIFSVISVVAYTGLILLALTLSFRVYKSIMATVQKGEHGNPFKPYLDKDLRLPQDRLHQQVDVIVKHIQDMVVQLRRLFLVEDFFDTAKVLSIIDYQ